MKKIIHGAILLVACVLLFYFSPDTISMIFTGVMTLLIAFGFYVGIMRMNEFSDGFLYSMSKIESIKKMAVAENWLYVKQLDSLFHNRYLDRLFTRYVRKVEEVKAAKKVILPDIEESVNDDYLSLYSRKNIIDIIPGTLTGLGILGTFCGLLGGIGGIRFSSVDVVVDSISSLIKGIDTAFYTSIAGISLSLIFDIIAKLSWNDMMNNMLEFYELFHVVIIPSETSQKDDVEMNFYEKVLGYIERQEHAQEKD